MEKTLMASLDITAKEVAFLKALLEQEVFQLSGLDAVIKDKELKEDIAIAESLEKKIQGIKLVPA